jgi:thiamine-phosphate pyrophosphorylase
MSQHQRLILIAPAFATSEELLPSLEAALSAGRIDAVVLPLPEGDDRSLVNFAKAVGPMVQEANAALLLQDHMHLVARSGADGVHLTKPDMLEEALALLRPQERIVGCAGLRARHDAMEVAEAGCDYVMFGEPFADGGHLPLASVLERAQWWSEVFQTPCVTFVSTLGDVGDAAATGTEFVALGAGVFAAPQGVAAAVTQALETITATPAPER